MMKSYQYGLTNVEMNDDSIIVIHVGNPDATLNHVHNNLKRLAALLTMIEGCRLLKALETDPITKEGSPDHQYTAVYNV